MLITADEYKEMGFTADDDTELEQCLKRAEYIIAGITEGRAQRAVDKGGEAAEFVKRAAAFQTYMLLDKTTQQENKSSERVSIGDFSYSDESSSESNISGGLYDMSHETIRLLRASGILFGGLEVRG